MKLAVTILIFCVAALLALGMVMLYSSSMVQDGARYLVQQAIWCIAGVVGCVIMTVLDYRQLRRFWWLIFAAGVVMLALVLVPHIGSVKNHARRWFSYGRASFQPSEFGKVALIIALAWYGERHQRQMSKWSRGILLPGAMIGVTAALIFKEPDVGNALLVCTVSSILLLISGIRLSYILPPAILLALGVGIFIAHNPMRSGRVYSWMHLEETRKDKGQQAYEAMLAFGSGGVTGKGLGDGRQKLGFVPEQHTDFILSIIGEELGLAATLLIVAAFVAIVVCGIYISVNASDTFGLLLGSGISFLIGLQAFINVAVVTSVLPNKGLPLPFISYGGSNLIVMLSIVGILLSIARHSHLVERRPAGAGDSERLPARRSRSNPFKELRPAGSTGKQTQTFEGPTQHRSMTADSWLAP
ncbi:MAG TPA: putative lipid II flippase FtsW [Verrucomicrobiae bacterium]|nr:putative lipid II flippase FtsW [Verrucomicrobiae bacterium]